MNGPNKADVIADVSLLALASVVLTVWLILTFSICSFPTAAFHTHRDGISSGCGRGARALGVLLVLSGA